MSFLKNAWYVAAWSENLRIGEPEERTILGETLVIYRTSLGVVTVLNNRCPHRFAPLHMGKVCANGNLRCGYHGLEFDSSGKCAKNPHGHTASALRVRSYASLERYGAVWVWMGDRPADEAAMPDLRVLEEAPSQDVTYRDSVRMQAHYELVMNNLMDLSHVPFLHGGLLGNDDTVAAEVKVLQENDTVTVTRYMQSVVPAPFFEMLFRGNGTLVDNWNSITWIAPTCMINDNGVTLPGTPKAQGTGVFGLHLLTPETDRSTMYYFVAVRQNPLPFPEPVRQDIMAKLKSMRRFAFVTQDGPIIEGQQRLMDSAGPDVRPALLESDRGTVLYKRILDKKILAETSP
jgi:phenylpropionate dioxygenase-like ring-hydroxylating dioxygenase large terminal subunit